jgi:hypothetical protein
VRPDDETLWEGKIRDRPSLRAGWRQTGSQCFAALNQRRAHSETSGTALEADLKTGMKLFRTCQNAVTSTKPNVFRTLRIVASNHLPPSACVEWASSKPAPHAALAPLSLR